MKPENVSLERIDGGWEMSVDYEVRKPLMGNLDVVGMFQASERLTNQSRE